MTINNKSERNYRGKYLGWPVTSYGADVFIISISRIRKTRENKSHGKQEIKNIQQHSNNHFGSINID